MYSCCTASSSGDGSISNSVDFFSATAADDVEIGEVREPLQADAVVEAVDLIGAALRLAITPPMRTP